MPPGLVSADTFLVTWRQSSSHVFTWLPLYASAFLSVCLPLTRTPVIADQGSNLMASFKLSDLFKGPISKCSRFGDSDLSPWIRCEHCSVAQLCLTLGDPMDCSPPGSSVHGVLQARILEWVAMPSPRRSSRPRDWTLRLLCLLHWQADSLPPSHLGSPMNLLRGGERQSSSLTGLLPRWKQVAQYLEYSKHSIS